MPQEYVEDLRQWIAREAEFIASIRPSDVKREKLREEWMAKVDSLYARLCGPSADVAATAELTGMKPADRDLVPDMRNAGPTVGLYLVREGGDDELKDTVPVRQAVRSHPPGGYASQGSMSYSVQHPIKVRSQDAEQRVKRLLRPPQGNEVAEYFHRMFGDPQQGSPFPKDPWDVMEQTDLQVPQDLSVKYQPHRFYCANCGATYSDKQAGDDRCSECRAELRQLTELYVCGGCGKTFEPPVPKVCINARCVETAKDRNGRRFMDGPYRSVGKGDTHNAFFRFTALPQLKWQCRKCLTEINYHAWHDLPTHLAAQISGATYVQGKSTPTPIQVAKHFLGKPESWWGKNYEGDGFHPSVFACPTCKKAGKYKKIFVKNIPSRRTETHDYIRTNEPYAEPLSVALGALSFPRVEVLTLGRTYYERFFSYSEQAHQIEHGRIFPDRNGYLASSFSTQAVFFDLRAQLDAFLNERAQANVCRTGQCACAPFTVRAATEESEGDEQTRPEPLLLDWEKGRKPDPRRRWCDVVQGLVPGKTCPGQDVACPSCTHFVPDAFLRYLTLHTLKHALILALPKYTGIGRHEVVGYLHPNDRRDVDLALVDLSEGGSGAFYLLRKNWDAIWRTTGELLDIAQEDQGQLLLLSCRRYNRDLCVPLARAFHTFVSARAPVAV